MDRYTMISLRKFYLFRKGNNLWFATRGVIKKLASMTQLQGVLKTRLDCAKFIVQLFVWYWTCRLLLPFFVVFSFVCCFVYLLYAQRALFERVAKTVFFFCFPVVLDNVKHIYFSSYSICSCMILFVYDRFCIVLHSLTIRKFKYSQKVSCNKQFKINNRMYCESFLVGSQAK